jgi:hypothetical protein
MANVVKRSKGGSRPGERRGGRKKGTPNKKTAALVAKVEASGMTPLEIMLEAAREHHSVAMALEKPLVILNAAGKEQKVVDRLGLMQSASALAAQAAPYVHPRLAAIEHTGKGGTQLMPPALYIVAVTPGSIGK